MSLEMLSKITRVLLGVWRIEHDGSEWWLWQWHREADDEALEYTLTSSFEAVQYGGTHFESRAEALRSIGYPGPITD